MVPSFMNSFNHEFDELFPSEPIKTNNIKISTSGIMDEGEICKPSGEKILKLKGLNDLEKNQQKHIKVDTLGGLPTTSRLKEVNI